MAKRKILVVGVNGLVIQCYPLLHWIVNLKLWAESSFNNETEVRQTFDVERAWLIFSCGKNCAGHAHQQSWYARWSSWGSNILSKDMSTGRTVDRLTTPPWVDYLLPDKAKYKLKTITNYIAILHPWKDPNHQCVSQSISGCPTCLYTRLRFIFKKYLQKNSSGKN